SYIRLRAVRVLHPARHPPERPRVSSWPSDVKAGAGRDTRTVVERCGRTSGTAPRRLGLRKREAVSARSSICQLPCMEPKKAFPLHRWPKVAFSSPPVAISRTARVFDCAFGAIRQWAGPRNGRFDPVRKTPLQCGWSQQMSITILGDE